MKRTAFTTTALLATLLASAQQTDTAELLPVEIRAIRAGANSPFAKTNLGKAEIRKENLGQDLPFIINQTPSVVANSDAGNGVGYTGLRIRGTDATRINITLNGIPYNDAESQGTFLVNLPDFASSVSSIQIQRGVGTSTNGAGSFGATINFSTNEVNRKAYAEASNSFGSFNTWKNTLRGGTGLLGNHFTVDARLSRISSDGYVDRASTDLRAFYVSGAYLSDRTNLRLNVFSGKERTYQAWYGVSESDLMTNRRVNYAGTEKPGAPYENEVDNYRQDHYQFFADHRLNERWVLNAALFLTRGLGYYEQYKAEEDYADYNLPYPQRDGNPVATTDLIRRLWLDNYFYGTTFSGQYTGARTSLIFGGAATRYDGDHYGTLEWVENGLTGSPYWYNLPASKKDLNLYGKWQQSLTNRLQTFVDLQYRLVDYQLFGFRNNPGLQFHPQYHFFNPKAGLSYRSGPLLAYASLAVARKEPNRDDFEAGAGQQPRPEVLRDLETGLEYRSARSFWSANVYYMDYKDQLVLTGRINDVGAYTRTNIPESYRLGLELQGSVSLLSWLKAGANLTLSRNRIENFTEFVDDYDAGGQKSFFYAETPIAFSPSVISAGTLTFLPLPRLELSLQGKYVGEQFLDNTGNNARSLDAYYNQDLRLLYTLQPKGFKGIDLLFHLNNAFDARYEPNGYTFSYIYGNSLATENYYFPMAGRNFLLGLNIRL